MNKRTIIIALSAVVLIVVGTGIGIGVYFLIASSPSVQAGIHDWLETPNGLSAVANVTLTIATFAAVIIALYGTRYERIKAREDREDAQRKFLEEQKRAQEVLEDERQRFKEAQDAERKRFEIEREQFEKAQEEGRRQFLEAQKKTRETQEEGRRQFLEAQYAANHPLLVPIAQEPGLEQLSQLPANVPWNAPHIDIRIRNAGTGIATNVWGLLRCMWVHVAFIPDIEHDLGEMDEAKGIELKAAVHRAEVERTTL